MAAFRFLTAGESHGPALGVTVEGVPAGLALTADGLAVDLARRQRGYGRGARQAIEQDRAEILAGVRHGLTLGSPILLLVRNRDWENWTQVMSVEAADRRRGRGPADRGGRRQQARDAGHPRPARSRRSGRRPEVRLQRRPQRPRTRIGARDGGTGRGRRDRPRVPRGTRDRRLVVHGRGRRRRPGSRQRDPVARRGGRLAAALPGSRGRGPDDRPDRRGAVGRRHGRWRLRGRRPRAADRARVVRALGSPPGRRPGRRCHEHQHRQGRRVRARLRADPSVRVGRP